MGAEQSAYERAVINLIASDNARPRIQAVDRFYDGDMIQEGVRGERPFAGAALHDEIEAFAEQLACDVFKAEHANLQPHSCSQANQAVYHALLQSGDPVLALGFKAGGHLTHGLKVNFSGRFYRFTFYGTDAEGLIDYSGARALALSVRPKLIVCGSSSYPRLFDAERLRCIADEVGAKLMLDLSHEAGLIAGGVISNPVPFADVATMSLDKTLRGPFGGLILSRSHLATNINRAVHPGTQSSFPIRKLIEAAHALILTRTAWFRLYAQAVLDNAKTLERCLSTSGAELVTGGTDKHYLVLDVEQSFGLSGVDAERRLESINILTSRQTLPRERTNRAAGSSGIRLGTAWATSRGYLVSEFEEIARLILVALSGRSDDSQLNSLAHRVGELVRLERPGDVWGANVLSDAELVSAGEEG